MNLIAAITGIGFALNPLTALSGAPQSGALEAGGVWVTLCATGSEVWIDFSGEGRKPDGPPPAQPHIKACHAGSQCA